MRHVQVSSKTYRDNTGRSIDFPTIFVEYNGETLPQGKRKHLNL